GLNIALEGGHTNRLADFSVYTKNKRFIDLFNSGTGTIRWSADVSDEWVRLSERSGLFEKEKRIWVTIDWAKAPKGKQQEARVIIEGTGKTLNVRISAFNPAAPAPDKVKGFVESHGYVSIEAEHYSRKADKGAAGWEIVAGLGRTGNSMTVLPPMVSAVIGSDNVWSSPVMEYDVYLFTTGIVTVTLYSSPTRPINGDYGLRYAVSFDEGIPIRISGGSANTMDNLRKMQEQFTISTAGQHVLKVWMVDPGMVLDKIVIDTGGVAESYLGPPESFANQKQPVAR
ncbi:MAG: glycosyl hydrolase 115 family protein, partial [Planctomycetota bacterium]